MNSFHKLITLAAKNEAFEALHQLLRYDDKLSLFLEYIRKEVGGESAGDHIEIMRRTKARNADQAEEAMARHIESLIRDVNCYWAKEQTKRGCLGN